jgi:hypothetical protein
MPEKTSFENRMQILAELWLNYRNDENYEEFIKYNDLGLPLAYAIAEGIVETTPPAENFINETFELLLAGLGVEDDDFENLDEILGLVDE